MTREEAKKLIKGDPSSYYSPNKMMEKIDLIYDEFEKEKIKTQQIIGRPKCGSFNPSRSSCRNCSKGRPTITNLNT